MIIDGRAIAKEIAERLRHRVTAQARPLSVGIIYAGSNSSIDQFIRIKSRFGEQIGVTVQVYRFSQDVDPAAFMQALPKIIQQHDGLVIQLPLPAGLDAEQVLNLVPPEKDIDVLSGAALRAFVENRSPMMPPVAGAVQEVFRKAAVDPRGKKIVIIGRGRLVGQPVELWLRREGWTPTVVGRAAGDLTEIARSADIIISGAGSPGIIRPDMVKPDAVIVDAGTSEEGGRVVGDADPACARTASVFTPVPGGLGPITVAVLFDNLIANHEFLSLQSS